MADDASSTVAIHVTVDSLGALELLSEAETNQLPFAISKGINDTAKTFQSIQRIHDESIFTPRRPDWQSLSIKITEFSNKANLEATIEVMPPGSDGAAKADILGKFEDQPVKLPFKGQYVAVPTSSVRRIKNDLIPSNLRISKLNLHTQGQRVIGDERTFLIHTSSGHRLILQRQGHGAGSTTVGLWFLVPSVKITDNLDFIANAEKVVDTEWEKNFEAAFTLAMQTAK